MSMGYSTEEKSNPHGDGGKLRKLKGGPVSEAGQTESTRAPEDELDELSDTQSNHSFMTLATAIFDAGRSHVCVFVRPWIDRSMDK